jgi:hypothetical protein
VIILKVGMHSMVIESMPVTLYVYFTARLVLV